MALGTVYVHIVFQEHQGLHIHKKIKHRAFCKRTEAHQCYLENRGPVNATPRYV